ERLDAAGLKRAAGALVTRPLLDEEEHDLARSAVPGVEQRVARQLARRARALVADQSERRRDRAGRDQRALRADGVLSGLDDLGQATSREVLRVRDESIDRRLDVRQGRGAIAVRAAGYVFLGVGQRRRRLPRA